MTAAKRCVICKQERPAHAFNRKRASKDGLQPHCRECNRVASRAYYRRNRAKHLVDVARNGASYRDRNRAWLLAHLRAQPCVDCGEPDPMVLDFDHVRGEKKGSVGQLASLGVSLETLREEVAKCEVRCVNCHRRRTASVQRHWRLR